MTPLNLLMNAQSRLEALVAERLSAEEAMTTLERDREAWKTSSAINLVGQPNPLTGKPHSLSSAETAVSDLPRYRAFTVAVDRARLANLSARLRYDVALEAVRTARVVLTVQQRDDALVGV